MWRNHRSVFQGHLKYIRNDIVKLLCIGILRYSKRVQEMHYLANQLPPPLINGDSFEEYNWKVCYKELSFREIRVDNK